jgi:hypothetical protein
LRVSLYWSEFRGRRDSVAFQFELTGRLCCWTTADFEVVGGEWKKDWRGLSLNPAGGTDRSWDRETESVKGTDSVEHAVQVIDSTALVTCPLADARGYN